MGKFLCQRYNEKTYGKGEKKMILKKRKRKPKFDCEKKRFIFTNPD